MIGKLTIQWSAKSIKDMRRLSLHDRERVIAKIEQYVGDPELLANQAITLTGSRYKRLRAGNHRVIFDVKWGKAAIMLVLRVRHRREAYD